MAVGSGCSTPKQRIVQGTRTIEGYFAGHGALTIWSEDGEVTATYNFGEESRRWGVEVAIGQLMQWEAAPDSILMFYELCEPPYQDGRFETVD